MPARGLTRALPPFLALGLTLGVLSPAEPAPFPRVKGSWVGTLTLANGQPGGDARLFVSWQKKKKCRGTLTARGFEGIPVRGTVTRQGKIRFVIRAGGVRGRVAGRLSADRTQVTGRWSETRGGKTVSGRFVMVRDE